MQFLVSTIFSTHCGYGCDQITWQYNYLSQNETAKSSNQWWWSRERAYIIRCQRNGLMPSISSHFNVIFEIKWVEMSILVAPIRWQTFERTNFILNWNRIDVANFTLNFNSCRIHFYSQHAIGQSGIWSKPSKHHKNSTPNATRKIECARNYCAQRQCNYSFGYENVETISLDRNVLNGEMPSTKLANCLHTHIAYVRLSIVQTHMPCAVHEERDRGTDTHTHTIYYYTSLTHILALHIFRLPLYSNRIYAIHSSISFRQFN